MTTIDHPAKYTQSILDALEEEVNGLRGPVLDMFAGTGRIHTIGRDDTLGIELEPEWAGLHPRTYRGDATALPYPSGIFGIVATSPCYGNRMADRYDGRDGSRRHTYRIALGHELSRGSAAGLQWGEEYRELHRKAWKEALRVLRPGGRLIINVADHIRGGQRQPVSDFHRRTAEEVGFRHLHTRMVATPGMRQGRNRELRTSGEYLIVLESPRCGGFTSSSPARHQR
jgi:SAM-dependent methyltransferase